VPVVATDQVTAVREPPVTRHERRRHRRRFWSGLVLIVTGGLAWRILYVLIVTRHENSKLYDSAWYELQALTLADGHFFPILFGHGPDAAHPPLTSLVLTPVSYFFGLHVGATPQRLTMAVLGAVVVLLVGILGRVLAGPGVGLLAALLAAAYPNMWIPNGIVMSETLTMLLISLIMLSTYRLFRSPTWGNAALLGLACGVEMLVRAELVLLLPCLIVPAALVVRAVPWRTRCTLAAVGLVVAGLTVGPWVGRNLASFKDPTVLSTGLGPVLLGANCPLTYYGPSLGSWSLACSIDVPHAADQSVESARQTAAAEHYAEKHLGRLPLVALARVGRVWDFYEPLAMVDGTVNEGRPVPASFAGLLAYYLLLPAAAIGVVALRRRRVRVWPMLVIAAVVTFVAATGYGLVRFRAEFEVPLVVLAAVGLDAAWRQLRRRWSRDRRPPVANVGSGSLEAA
jgi:4-amino-4-deoxy-L-arabinose transferase-like glycosyltransferase